MSVKPLDMQIVFTKVTEVGRTQHIVNQQSDVDRQQIAAQWQQIAVQRQSTVQNTSAAAGGIIQRDNGSNQKERKSSGYKQKKREEILAEEIAHDPIRGNNIDIKT